MHARWIMCAAASALTGLACAAISVAAQAQDVAKFYHGKTVSLIVSSAPGGGYDATARLTARYMAKYIPGTPAIVVQNMPGAGGIRAPNYVYNVGARDGTVFALMQNTIPFEPLVGNKAATFDATKLLWLGSPNFETGVLMVMPSSGVKTLEDLTRKQITVAVPAMASTPAFHSRLLIQVLGAKLRIVPGYPSSTAALLAMERGEADSFPNFYNSMMQSRPTWMKEGKVLVLAQWGPHKEKEIPDVPYLQETIKDPAKLALLKAASASFALGRPFMMPPGVPQERFKAMRKALWDTFNDPGFAKDADKIGFSDLAPQSGEQLEKTILDVYASPPDVVKRLRMVATGEGM